MKEHRDGSNFDFLIGKSIKDVKNNILICNDDTEIIIEENEGCGGCGDGWSSLDDLSILKNNQNIITNVIAKYNNNDNEFVLFIYYDNGQVNEINGNDGYGNGYYGGGFYITIKR